MTGNSKNEMNLYIMTAEEAVRWYIPQSEEEKYLLKLLGETTIDANYVENLEDELQHSESDLRQSENEKEEYRVETLMLTKRVKELEEELKEQIAENKDLQYKLDNYDENR